MEHTWIIENFSLRPQKTGECLYSPIFSDQSERKVEWKLKLYPKGRNEEFKHFISTYVCLHKPSKNLLLNATYCITFLNKNQDILEISEQSSTREFNGSSTQRWGDLSFCSQDKISHTTLPGDELHIKCELIYEGNPTSLTGHSTPSLPTVSTSGIGNLVDHYKQLMESKSQSDIIIHVKQKKFEAHKLILSTRSPVFLAMFENNHTEKKTNTVKIEGIEPTVFAEVLRFIYTDEVENLDELAAELLAAAERYMLDFLKAKCEAYLSEKITVETCAELLLLADLHSADRLKKMVLDFFRFRIAEVAETASWQQLMKSANPLLFRDISMVFIPKPSSETAQRSAQ